MKNTPLGNGTFKGQSGLQNGNYFITDEYKKSMKIHTKQMSQPNVTSPDNSCNSQAKFNKTNFRLPPAIEKYNLSQANLNDRQLLYLQGNLLVQQVLQLEKITKNKSQQKKNLTNKTIEIRSNSFNSTNNSKGKIQTNLSVLQLNQNNPKDDVGNSRSLYNLKKIITLPQQYQYNSQQFDSHSPGRIQKSNTNHVNNKSSTSASIPTKKSSSNLDIMSNKEKTQFTFQEQFITDLRKELLKPQKVSKLRSSLSNLKLRTDSSQNKIQNNSKIDKSFYEIGKKTQSMAINPKTTNDQETMKIQYFKFQELQKSVEKLLKGTKDNARNEEINQLKALLQNSIGEGFLKYKYSFSECMFNFKESFKEQKETQLLQGCLTQISIIVMNLLDILEQSCVNVQFDLYSTQLKMINLQENEIQSLKQRNIHLTKERDQLNILRIRLQGEKDLVSKQNLPQKITQEINDLELIESTLQEMNKQSLTELVMKMQKKIQEITEKEAKLIKLVLAIKRTGIDIEKVYNEEVINDTDSDIQGSIRSINQSLAKMQIQSLNDADNSIVNDSDESSFNYQGQDAIDSGIESLKRMQNMEIKNLALLNTENIKTKIHLDLSRLKQAKKLPK